MRNSDPRSDYGFSKLVWTLIDTTLQHPFTYVKVLIQIGYEPIPPNLETIFGRTYLALPNAFSYVDYISCVDGLRGCFRGLLPNLCCMTVNFLVTKLMMNVYFIDPLESTPKIAEDQGGKQLVKGLEQMNHHPEGQAQLDTLSNNANPQLQNFEKDPAETGIILRETGLRLICMTYGVFASHPFYVIMVRSMGEFVGRENNYTSSMRNSFIEIYRNHGSAGYFKGVLCRLLAEYIGVIAPALVILLVAKFRNRRSWLSEQILSRITETLTSRFTNKLYVVANARAVNASGLKIGHPPYTSIYRNSIQCWKDLSSLNQLDRGYFKCWRSYRGPTIDVNGKLIPDPMRSFFGPKHSTF